MLVAVIPSRSLLELLLVSFSLPCSPWQPAPRAHTPEGAGSSSSCMEFAESTAFLKDPKFARDHTLLALFSPVHSRLARGHRHRQLPHTWAVEVSEAAFPLSQRPSL